MLRIAVIVLKLELICLTLIACWYRLEPSLLIARCVYFISISQATSDPLKEKGDLRNPHQHGDLLWRPKLLKMMSCLSWFSCRIFETVTADSSVRFFTEYSPRNSGASTIFDELAIMREKGQTSVDVCSSQSLPNNLRLAFKKVAHIRSFCPEH